jgi:hypothetical protein
MKPLFMLLAAGAVALACVQQARAQQPWTTAGDAVLAQMRGGFALAPGLMVSFGIVRTVRIDGDIVSHTRVHVEDLRSITADQARQIAQQVGSVTLVQNGAGNTVQLPAAQLAPGIVVQNTENNRRLQAVTELNATSNGMGLLQGINRNQALGDALKGALGH